MKEINENSRKRIIQLIQDFCDGSQRQFAERTGLNKGLVSQYVNGKRTPTIIAASAIGEVFKVSPAWIIGFNVPIKPVITTKGNHELLDSEWELIEKYRLLDARGKQAVHNILDCEYLYVSKN